jgi:hypothetical protein
MYCKPIMLTLQSCVKVHCPVVQTIRNVTVQYENRCGTNN